MGEQLKTLIVDDNESLCTTMSFILKRKGYDVSVAHDGASGIAQFQANPADIVLSDIKMPDMNGVDMFKEIKKINPQATVILMTAYAVPNLIRDGMHAGAYGVLYKPLDVEKVIDIFELSQQKHDGQHILIVDDDKNIGTMLRNFFTRQGFQVAIAESGEEAIEQVKTQSFIVVFIDMVMPHLNGLETFTELHRIAPDSKYIMMSGFREHANEMMIQAMNGGASAKLYKPFQLSELSSLLKTYCQ